MSLYALNLFDLADNDDYLAYSRQSAAAVGEHGGRVVALGKLRGSMPTGDDTPPREAMVLVEWPSQEAFDEFMAGHEELHPLRENGTRNYLWWSFDRLEDLRPLLKGR